MNEEVTTLRKQLSQAMDLLTAGKAGRQLPRNMDFVQVQRSELRALTDLSKKNSLAFELLMLFAQSMNKQNAVMMSFETMSFLTDKKRTALSSAIKALKDDQWTQVIKVGTANAYVVNSAVFWTDKGNKKYTSFSAQVITSLGEQEKDVRNSTDIKLKRVPVLEGGEHLTLGSDSLPPPDQQDINLN